MAFKNFGDLSSQNVHNFLYEQKFVVRLCVVYPLIFDQNQCWFLLNKLKEEICSFTLT